MLAMAMAKNDLLHSLSETLAGDKTDLFFFHTSTGASKCHLHACKLLRVLYRGSFIPLSILHIGCC
jgi:hypothetical protein